MNWYRCTVAQFRLSQRVFWRRLGFALTGVIVPLGLGIGLPLDGRGKALVQGLKPAPYVLTGFIAFALFWIVYNLVNSTTSRRDALIYKRLRATALPETSIFAGEALSASVLSLVEVVVLVVFGIVVLHAGLPSNVPLLILTVLLGVAMFAILAVAASGVLPSAELSTWIVTPFMVAVLFGSGVTTPISSLPSVLQGPAKFLPLTPVVELVRTSYFGRDFVHATAHHVAVPVGFLASFHASLGALDIMVAWTAIGVACALKWFRWDPRHTS